MTGTKRLLIGLVAVAGSVSLLVGNAFAGSPRTSTSSTTRTTVCQATLTLSYVRGTNTFQGHLATCRDCAANRTIEIFRVTKSGPVLVLTATTDENGNFSISAAGLPRGHYFARVLPVTRGDHRCRGDRSNTVFKRRRH